MTLTGKLLRIIFEVVIWVFVPLIAIIALVYTRKIINRTEDKKYKSSMNAGFWAGFVLFIMILIYQVGVFVTTGYPERNIYQGFSLPLAIGTALIAFLLFMGGKWVGNARLGGFAVLVVTFLSFYTILHYVFIRSHNELILSLALGITFGFLMFFAIAPAAVKKTLAGVASGSAHH